MVALVLFGAGASYGSEDVTPHPPPLGNGPSGLFAGLCKRGGLATELPRELKDDFEQSFEKGMAAFYEHADGNIMRFQREMAQYLATFQPGPRNLYRGLIEKVNPRRVVYSTLNYDLLIEQAASSLGLNYTYSTTLAPNSIRLLKPHGSSNFWPDVPVGMIRGLTVKRSGLADVVAPVRPLSREQTLHRCQIDDSFAPAIAKYAEGKQVKVCPDYVNVQQSQWTEIVARSRRIFISGVRVHPADTHVWGALAETDADIFYYGLGNDKEEFLTWRSQSKKSSAYFVEGDFSMAVRQIVRHLA